MKDKSHRGRCWVCGKWTRVLPAPEHPGKWICVPCLDDSYSPAAAWPLCGVDPPPERC